MRWGGFLGASFLRLLLWPGLLGRSRRPKEDSSGSATPRSAASATRSTARARQRGPRSPPTDTHRADRCPLPCPCCAQATGAKRGGRRPTRKQNKPPRSPGRTPPPRPSLPTSLFPVRASEGVCQGGCRGPGHVGITVGSRGSYRNPELLAWVFSLVRVIDGQRRDFGIPKTFSSDLISLQSGRRRGGACCRRWRW